MVLEQNVSQAVAFWLHYDGKILFHLRSKECRDCHLTWDCGGGGIDGDEVVLDALKREIKEEYLLEPEDYVVERHLPISEFSSEETGAWHINLFICRILNKDNVGIGEPHKALELLWCDLDNLPENLHPGVRVDMEKHMEDLRELVI